MRITVAGVNLFLTEQQARSLRFELDCQLAGIDHDREVEQIAPHPSSAALPVCDRKPLSPQRPGGGDFEDLMVGPFSR